MNFRPHSVCISGRKITFEVVTMQMLARGFEFLMESEYSVFKSACSYQMLPSQSCPKISRVSTSLNPHMSRGDLCLCWSSFGSARCPLQNHHSKCLWLPISKLSQPQREMGDKRDLWGVCRGAGEGWEGAQGWSSILVLQLFRSLNPACLATAFPSRLWSYQTNRLLIWIMEEAHGLWCIKQPTQHHAGSGLLCPM